MHHIRSSRQRDCCCLHLHFFVLVLPALLGLPSGANSDTYRLRSIQESRAPTIEQRHLHCHMDLVFLRRAPENYWIYYSKSHRQFVVDFYGATIELAEGVKPEGRCLFKDVTVENRETTMAISGEQSLVRIAADSGWHVKAYSLNARAIRIEAWKPLRTPKIGSAKKRLTALYVVLAATAAAATLAVIVFLGIREE